MAISMMIGVNECTHILLPYSHYTVFGIEQFENCKISDRFFASFFRVEYVAFAISMGTNRCEHKLSLDIRLWAPQKHVQRDRRLLLISFYV